MLNCNNCARKGCDILRMHRSKKRILSVKEMRSKCKRQIKPRQFKLPLLYMALTTNPEGFVECMSQFKCRIVEKKSYPYFTLDWKGAN